MLGACQIGKRPIIITMAVATMPANTLSPTATSVSTSNHLERTRAATTTSRTQAAASGENRGFCRGEPFSISVVYPASGGERLARLASLWAGRRWDSGE
jgi:hypothetical protein